MKLLLDIGNTRVKWAREDAGALTETGIELLADDIAGALDRLLRRFGPAPDQVVAANVAGPQAGKFLQDQVRKHWGLGVRFAESAGRFGPVRNGYADPQQLGVDRWLAILAAYERVTAAVCVVDAGTAFTLDLVAASGRHLGGFIAPGLALMQASLEARTGDLKQRVAGHDSGGPAVAEPATDTAQAIRSGAALALAGLVDRGLQAHDFGGAGPALLVTGGDALLLLKLLPPGAVHRPQLVLEGLLHWSTGGAGDVSQSGA